jgi:hypothetical protein
LKGISGSWRKRRSRLSHERKEGHVFVSWKGGAEGGQLLMALSSREFCPGKSVRLFSGGCWIKKEEEEEEEEEEGTPRILLDDVCEQNGHVIPDLIFWTDIVQV